MIRIIRQNGSLISIITLVCLLLTPALSQAGVDTWKGVFSFQKQMAEYGNPHAQVKLGEMYEEGHGTEQNYDLAEQWYQKAADQGFTPALSKLSQLESKRKSEEESQK